jgi:hypothetical protein
MWSRKFIRKFFRSSTNLWTPVLYSLFWQCYSWVVSTPTSYSGCSLKSSIKVWQSSFSSVRKEDMVTHICICPTCLTHQYLLCHEPVPICTDLDALYCFMYSGGMPTLWWRHCIFHLHGTLHGIVGVSSVVAFLHSMGLASLFDWLYYMSF